MSTPEDAPVTEKVTVVKKDGSKEVKHVDKEGKVIKTEHIPKKSVLG